MLYSQIISQFVKVFKTEPPVSFPECNRITALKGDTVAFQVVYFSDETLQGKIVVNSDFGKKLTVRSVEYVPSNYPCIPDVAMKDGHYLKTSKCEFPDILRKLRGGNLKITKNKYRTIFIDIEVPKNFKAGDYEITVDFSVNDEVISTEKQLITVYNAVLPEAKLIHTEWFHTDCIADYYGYDVFSDKYWAAVKNFMKIASKRGINMILTPLFTPPLDTQVGGERTTVQLVDVKVDNGKYSFGFDNLKKWIAIADECKIKYFEMNHMFTQWGAKAAPKIMATVDGEYKRIFGWDTPVEDGVYPDFLRIFLPELVKFLKDAGVDKRCYFHVSDEPHLDNIDAYKRCKSIISPALEGFPMMDALSTYEFYESGVCELPVPSINHIQTFIDHKTPNLWSYYCVSQGYKTSNRFMALPLTRTRAIGVQWFKYNVKGFLHWGFNFYNAQFSLRHINPYKVTDADGHFPSGDAFVVYPGAAGKPEESIRLMAFFAAQQDLRALTALADKTSYEHVMELIEGDLDSPITFDNYPHSEIYYTNLRNKVNKELSM